MSYFAVTRQAGPGWVDEKSAFEQPGIDEHAAFMNALAREGVILFAGPVAGSERGRIRVLLVMSADNEAEIRRRLADDPWARVHRLVITSAESWMLMVGAERLGG